MSVYHSLCVMSACMQIYVMYFFFYLNNFLFRTIHVSLPQNHVTFKYSRISPRYSTRTVDLGSQSYTQMWLQPTHRAANI